VSPGGKHSIGTTYFTTESHVLTATARGDTPRLTIASCVPRYMKPARAGSKESVKRDGDMRAALPLPWRL
jgi:hypothetical protein